MASVGSIRHRALYGEKVDPPALLNHRRIFILPTQSGLLFGLLLVIMLLGAINYSNSLAHLLTFLLGSLGLVSMLHTYRNLSGLRISSSPSEPVFARDRAYYRLLLDNPGGPARYAITIKLAAQSSVVVDIPPHTPRWLTLPLPAEHRGELFGGPVLLATRFPLGLFRAWTRLDLGMSCIVYPHPAPADALRAAAGETDPGRGTETSTLDDFVGLRPYIPGDSPRHIHWKAAARGRDLLTKQFTATAASDTWIDWYVLPSEWDTETRLSVLCRWVLDAHPRGHPYGLRLPAQQISPDQGEPHRGRCLEALAFFGLPRVA